MAMEKYGIAREAVEALMAQGMTEEAAMEKVASGESVVVRRVVQIPATVDNVQVSFVPEHVDAAQLKALGDRDPK